jgi:hypothetical protein
MDTTRLVNFRISNSESDALAAHARRTGQTQTDVVRQHIRSLNGSDDPARALIRAVAAHCIAAARGLGHQPLDIARSFWPQDRGTHGVIERAASAPAMTNVTNWATELGASATAAFLGSLSQTASGALFSAAPQFSLTGLSTMHLPRASSMGATAWVLEGGPVGVPQGVTASPVLGPIKKIGIVESITR